MWRPFWILIAEWSMLFSMLIFPFHTFEELSLWCMWFSAFQALSKQSRIFSFKVLLFYIWSVQLICLYRCIDADFTINLWSPTFLWELKHSNANSCSSILHNCKFLLPPTKLLFFRAFSGKFGTPMWTVPGQHDGKQQVYDSIIPALT